MSERIRTFTGPAVIALAFAALTMWTWGKWPDALVDFGRELYVPWQLSKGLTLYGDLAYFNGPLSPTVNAAWFRLTGPSLRALVLLNLVVVAAIVVMLYGLLRSLAGRFVASAGSLSFLVFFAFAQFMPGGSYNYLAPYSHEATHGIALSLAALRCLGAHLRSGRRRWALAAGVAAGLAFLTKAEFPIALVPAVGVGLLLHHLLARTPGRRVVPIAALAAAGFLLPPALAFAWLSSRLPAGEALRGVAGAWNYLFDERLHALRFYQDVRGTLDVGESLARIGAWLARYAAVFVPAAVAAALVGRDARARRVVAAVAAAGAATAVLVGRAGRDWENLARPFPLILAAAIVVIAGAVLRSGSARRSSWREVLGLSCLVFALLLLLKAILHVSLLHYGFVLAMPAGIAIVALSVGFVPVWLDGRGRSGLVFRAAALGAIVGFAIVQVGAARMWLGGRTVEIGQGADRFLIHQRDRGFADVLVRLQQLRAPAETLVVVPEGVMLNYLLRATNPAGVVNFLPPEMIMWGERRILGACRAHPPDWVVIMNRGVSEYGYRFFGDDYARDLYSWIETNYEVVDRVFELDAWGQTQPTAAILRRRTPGGH